MRIDSIISISIQNERHIIKQGCVKLAQKASKVRRMDLLLQKEVI